MRALATVVIGLTLASSGCTLNDRLQVSPKDAVCGMAVERQQAWVLVFDRRPYYFDSENCLQKFKSHPARYIDAGWYELNREP